jgi:hypothetical protein
MAAGDTPPRAVRQSARSLICLPINTYGKQQNVCRGDHLIEVGCECHGSLKLGAMNQMGDAVHISRLMRRAGPPKIIENAPIYQKTQGLLPCSSA